MSFSDEIKRIRERSFFTQEAFAKELNVAFSTVNRWETGKTVPNFKTMKRIRSFCKNNHIDFDFVDSVWEARE